MKNLILIAFVMVTYASSILAINSNPIIPTINNVDENAISVAGIVTYYGKNNGTTITTVTSTDGSTTTVIDYDCDSFFDYKCYSVETSAAGLTSLTDASEGVTYTGILVDSNPVEDKYKLLTFGENQ